MPAHPLPGTPGPMEATPRLQAPAIGPLWLSLGRYRRDGRRGSASKASAGPSFWPEAAGRPVGGAAVCGGSSVGAGHVHSVCSPPSVCAPECGKGRVRGRGPRAHSRVTLLKVRALWGASPAPRGPSPPGAEVGAGTRDSGFSAAPLSVPRRSRGRQPGWVRALGPAHVAPGIRAVSDLLAWDPAARRPARPHRAIWLARRLRSAFPDPGLAGGAG